MENLENNVVVNGSVNGSTEDLPVESNFLSDEWTSSVSQKLDIIHYDFVLTNTLLSALLGAFAVFCFFKFLFKG